MAPAAMIAVRAVTDREASTARAEAETLGAKERSTPRPGCKLARIHSIAIYDHEALPEITCVRVTGQASKQRGNVPRSLYIAQGNNVLHLTLPGGVLSARSELLDAAAFSLRWRLYTLAPAIPAGGGGEALAASGEWRVEPGDALARVQPAARAAHRLVGRPLSGADARGWGSGGRGW